MNKEEYGAVLWIWFVHAAIAGLLSAPVVFFGRNRVHWQAWELLVLIVPFVVWCLLFFSSLSDGKSMGNLAEPIYFALAVPVVALARVVIGSRAPEHVSAGILIALMCVVAACVFFFVPSLPE